MQVYIHCTLVRNFHLTWAKFKVSHSASNYPIKHHLISSQLVSDSDTKETKVINRTDFTFAFLL